LIVAFTGLSTTLSPTADAASAGRHRNATRAHGARCERLPRRAPRGCEASTSHSRTRPKTSKRRPLSAPNQAKATTPAAAPEQERAAAIAGALASTCTDTELTPEEGNIALIRASVLCLVNRERAENGVPPLKANTQLEAAAESHCSELIADDYFAHIAPSGETPVDRVRDTGYIPGPSDGYVIGENLAWGTYDLATPQSIVSAWIASPGHLANILETQYTETGIGITPAVPSSLAAGAPGATYAQEFGVIIQ
jgi:uncharacterized protein YkwD